MVWMLFISVYEAERILTEEINMQYTQDVSWNASEISRYKQLIQHCVV